MLQKAKKLYLDNKDIIVSSATVAAVVAGIGMQIRNDKRRYQHGQTTARQEMIDLVADQKRSANND